MAYRRKKGLGDAGASAPVNPEVLSQLFTMRLPDGREVAFVDWSDIPLFSTLDILSGASDSELFCFTYVVGDSVPASSNCSTQRTATENDTNVQTAGMMASQEEMLVYGIRPMYFELDCSTPADPNTAVPAFVFQPAINVTNLARIQMQYRLELEVTQKLDHYAGLEYYNSGMGPQAQSVYQATTQTTQRATGTAGMPTQEAVRSFVIPVHIGGQEAYLLRLRNAQNATLNFVGVDPANNAAPVTDASILVRTRIYFDGLWKRPVA